MFSFSFSVPTKLVFEQGAVNKVQEVAVHKKLLLVTGKRHAKVSGLTKQVIHLLHQNNAEVVVMDGIQSNLPSGQVEEGKDLVLKYGCKAVIGLGGGSVLDAARLIALASTHPGDFRDYRVTGPKSVPGITDEVLPVYTISTIPGTGSEMSPAALSVINGKKEVFYSPYLFPRVAYVDPTLATTASPHLCAKVGVDAFIQGLEAFVSSASQPFSDMFAETSMKTAWTWLPIAVANPQNLDAQFFMYFASITGFFSINQAGVGAIHALSNPLSARFKIHHGEALSILLPYVVDHNWDLAPEKFQRIAKLIDANDKTTTIELLNQWLLKLRLVKRLRYYGVTEADIDGMVSEAMNPDMSTNPGKLSEHDIRDIYLAAL